jgi:hypothetical protein
MAAVPEGKRIRDRLLPGIIAGVFGLLGVVVGGAATFAVQERQSDRDDAARAEESAAVARGTARIMRVEFASRVDAMNAALGGGYPRATISLATDLSTTDRRVVAAAMGQHDWNDVALAESRIGRAQRLLLRRPGEPLSAADEAAAQEYRRIFTVAIERLKAFDQTASK